MLECLGYCTGATADLNTCMVSSATTAPIHPKQQTVLQSTAVIIAVRRALSELLYACADCTDLNSLCLQAGEQQQHQQQQDQTLEQEHEACQISSSSAAAAAAPSSSSEEVALLLSGVAAGLQRDFEWMVSCESHMAAHRAS
jgi:hypothetical protein